MNDLVRRISGVKALDIDAAWQEVKIIDDADCIRVFHTGQKSVKLSAADCRHLAKELVAAAIRLEQRLKK